MPLDRVPHLGKKKNIGQVEAGKYLGKHLCLFFFRKMVIHKNPPLPPEHKKPPTAFFDVCESHLDSERFSQRCEFRHQERRVHFDLSVDVATFSMEPNVF
ncbi:MAG: hypothetical protein GXP25_23980 [Planctomycetes bacterium]|nr:hypothetical protein [Planctomycetota bacterium]